MLASFSSFASQGGNDGRWIFKTAFTKGGDKVGEIGVTLGNQSERTNISAGGNFIASVGRAFPVGVSGMSIQATIGWHWEGVSASNGDAGFDRYPLEIIPFYQFKQHRIGAGLTYGLSPTLDLTDAGGEKVKFKDSLGFLIEYDYMFEHEYPDLDLIIGLRYASIDYDTVSNHGNTVTGLDDIDGSYGGIVLGVGF